MPIQRKVFRIEESVCMRVRQRDAVTEAGGARSSGVASELTSLRASTELRGHNDREQRERVRAQVAEAQAFKHELELIHSAVKQSHSEMRSLGAEALDADRTARAVGELA